MYVSMSVSSLTPVVPALDWPGSKSGQCSCCEMAGLKAGLLIDPVGEDRGDVDSLGGGL